MEETLVVFRENQHHFGILPHEFDRHITLDQVVVSLVENIPSLWKFDCRQKSLKGYFIQLGSMAGLKHTNLSHKGYLFLKEYSKTYCWGVFLNDIYLQTPTKKIEKKITPVSNQIQVPDCFSSNIFHSVLQLHRKKIWIVNPLELFQHFQSQLKDSSKI